MSHLKPCVMHCHMTLYLWHELCVSLGWAECGIVQVKSVKTVETTFSSSLPM